MHLIVTQQYRLYGGTSVQGKRRAKAIEEHDAPCPAKSCGQSPGALERPQ